MLPATTLVPILEAHEAALVFPVFDAATAWELGSAVRAAFLTGPHASRGIVIAVELFSGHTLFRAAVGDFGVGPDNWSWVVRKHAAVRRFGTSSFLLGRTLAAREQTLADKGVSEAEYAAHGGALPIRVKGHPYPIGALIVSGLPQDADHELAAQAMAKVLGVQVESVVEAQ